MQKLKKNERVVLIVVIAMMLVACQVGNLESTTPTVLPTETVQPTETMIPTETPKPTQTPKPTRTPNLAATQVYEDFFAEVESFYDEGYLPSVAGEYVEMLPFEEEWAQMNWYQWWWIDENLVAETFVWRGRFSWQSASSTPNISGCGFVFDVDIEDGSAYAVVLDQSRVLVLDHNGYWVGNTRGTGKVKFTLPAEAEFTLIVNNEAKRIYVLVDGEFVGEYSIPLSEAIDGTIGFTVLSGTNKDYGTRCKITDMQLWLVE